MKKQIVAGTLGALLGWTGAAKAQDAAAAPVKAPAPRTAPAAPSAAAAGDANQRMANSIAMYLRASGAFKGCNLDIAFSDGVADIGGQVNDWAQRAEAIRIVRTIPGVFAVRDRLAVGFNPPPALAFAPPMMQFAPSPMGFAPPAPVAGMPAGSGILPAQALGPIGPAPLGPTPIGPGPGGPIPIGPVPKELPPEAGKGLPEPLSIMPMPTLPNPAYNPPPMPPYAWPTYAPYNNLSRVAYPTEYPYEAWPFIGPMYPFPKVPPGWRAVTLEWEDGYWWYKRKATGHDWWRVRYR